MERLQVFLELVTGQYKREAKEAATATGQISTSAKTADTSTQKMGMSLQSVGQVAKTFIAGAAVGAVLAFGKQAVAAASNLEESMNAVNVTFGDSAEGIHALGKESVTSFGLSQRAFNEFAVRFSAFAEQIATKDGRAVADVVEEMTTRVADFASVHNLTMEEAATIAQSTLAGETEAFRRFGGDVSAAAVELKGMELGLGDTSAELSEQEKILIRYELFMEQTAKTAGDFANTSDSLANQQKILTANFEEFSATIGALVVPVVADSIDVLNDLLTVINGLGDALPGTAEGSASLADSLKFQLDRLGPLALAYQIGSDWLDVFAEGTKDADDAVNAHLPNLQLLEQRHQANTVAAANSNTEFSRGPAILHEYNLMAQEAADATDESTAAIDANIAALQEQNDILHAQTDPLFALKEAMDKQAEAQAEVTRLQDLNKEHTPEYTDALQTLAEAGLSVEDAHLAIIATGGSTRAEFLKNRGELHLTWEQANALADELERIGAFDPPPINFTVTVNGTQYGSLAAAERAIQGVGRQHGGSVAAGSIYTVGEKGPETFIPSVPGYIIPQGQLSMHTQTSGGISFGDIYAMGTPVSIAHDIGQQVSLELRMA